MLTCLIDTCLYYYYKFIKFTNHNKNEINNDYIIMDYNIV